MPGEQDPDTTERDTVFGDAEKLELQQLQILKWLEKSNNPDPDTLIIEDCLADQSDLPDKWQLTRGIDLYKWQSDAIDKWFNEENKGTMKVVTGGGKTLLALALAEKLQNSKDPELRVAIVVPTIVLMNQWHDELIKMSNLPTSAIGRLGGGHNDDGFNDECRIMICVLVSACNKLSDMVNKSQAGNHLLLVIDECQRAGGAEMSKVLDTKRQYSLGLSATPERENDDESDYDLGDVGRELGPIIFRLNYAEALKEGLIPPFTIRHFGLPLNSKEQTLYDKLSRSIKESRAELQNIAPANSRTGIALFKWASKKTGDPGIPAGKYIADINRRKELIYSMESRRDAVRELIDEELKINPNSRIILFHENINQAMKLFVRLREAGHAVIAEHSQLSKPVRENGLDLFRKGVARILVSVKSLIEGFNVPEVDVGIIVASSSSPRQRIQSMGRVMRKHRGKDGEEKSSSIHILYAKNTVDEAIYGKIKWEGITGAKSNIYYQWQPGEKATEQEGPPRSPLPTENDIETQDLNSGDLYPGEYTGIEFSCDTALNVKFSDGSFADDSTDLAQNVINIKGSSGKFMITPAKNLVLVKVKENENWITRFVTRLDGPLSPKPENETKVDAKEITKWAEKADSGDPYPIENPNLREEWKFKQSGGGAIAKKIPNGEAFARTNNATEPKKGEQAEEIIKKIITLNRSDSGPVTKLLITDVGHVLYRIEGTLRFIGDIGNGLEFPDDN